MIKKAAIATLDRWFKKFIRLRDCDENGYCKCISCNKPIVFGSGELHAGHYWPGVAIYSGTKFDEKNVNGQCNHCNTFLEGNKQGYEKGLVKKYGKDAVEMLDIKKRNPMKWSEFEVRVLAKEYRLKCKELIKTKNFKVN